MSGSIFSITDGKICLDVLQMPPSGSYNPAITLESILLSIQLLLGSPNPDDPLRSDVSDEYRYNREQFNEQATKLSGHKVDTTASADKQPSTDDKKMDVGEDNIKITDSKCDSIVEDKTESKTVDGETSAAKPSRKRKHDGS